MASNLPLKHEPDQVPHHKSTAKLCINWLHLSPPSIDRMTNQINYMNPHKTKQNLRRTAMEREREDLPLRPAPLVLLRHGGASWFSISWEEDEKRKWMGRERGNRYTTSPHNWCTKQTDADPISLLQVNQPETPISELTDPLFSHTKVKKVQTNGVFR